MGAKKNVKLLGVETSFESRFFVWPKKKKKLKKTKKNLNKRHFIIICGHKKTKRERELQNNNGN